MCRSSLSNIKLRLVKTQAVRRILYWAYILKLLGETHDASLQAGHAALSRNMHHHSTGIFKKEYVDDLNKSVNRSCASHLLIVRRLVVDKWKDPTIFQEYPWPALGLCCCSYRAATGLLQNGRLTGG